MERISLIALAGMMALGIATAQAATIPVRAILIGTPWWVWGLLALLAYNGFALSKPRSLPLWRLLIQPAIFMGWGTISLALGVRSGPILALDWLAFAAAGGALAWATRADPWSIDRARGLVRIPGGMLPLMRSLAIFAAKYALAVAAALHLGSPAGLRLLDMAVSGASAGYFALWAGQLVIAYRRQPIAAALIAPRKGATP
ncbi:MAG TPA: hypothetical protein VJR47_20895 [Stellaceae bacterium]|nr:hypothetical protein [Stellaceae bacterium]